MLRYLVEAYVPRAGAQEAAAAGRRLRDAARELASEGLAVRYVRTTFLPEDEICFHVLEAGSVEVVREVCSRAGLGSPRIAAAVEVRGHKMKAPR